MRNLTRWIRDAAERWIRYGGTKLWALALVALVACGGDGVTDTGQPGIPARGSFSIVQGDGQEQTVTDTLPVELVAQVKDTATGSPIGNHLADWRVIDDGCGEPFVTTTETDADGFTDNEWVLGQRAHTRIDPRASDAPCRLELRLRVEGSSLVDTTFVAIARPGPVVGQRLDGLGLEGGSPLQVEMVKNAEELDQENNARVFDDFGNPVNFTFQFDSLAAVQDPDDWNGQRSVELLGPAGCGPMRVTVADTVIQRGVITAEDQDGNGTAENVRLDFTDAPFENPDHVLSECVR